MAEQFSTKMLILRHTKTASAGFVYEFTLDDENCTLDDVVVDSLRSKFALDSDSVRYTIQSKEGDILLLKLMKGLKHYGWSIHASNSISHPGTSAAVESVFYYEKAITAVRSSSSVQAVRSPTSSGSSTKSGIEECKSAGVYASKPLPSAPMKVSTVDETDDPSQRRGSVTVTTNRDKLLQKYNQHRRSSATKGLQGDGEGGEPTRLSVSQLSKSFTGSAPQPPAPAVSASASRVTVAAAVSTATATTPAVPPPQPRPQPAVAPPAEVPAVPQPIATEAPKLGAASAYPALVKRISSKGFMPVPAATPSTDNSISKTTANDSFGARSDGIAQAATSEPAASAGSKPVPPAAAPVQAPSRPPPVPPPATDPPVPSPVPAVSEDQSSVSPPAPASPASEDSSVPVTPTPSVAASTPPVSPVGAPGPASPAPVQSEPAEESHHEIVRSSANPLSSGFLAQKRVAGTADNDPHEANRTNHYSKLGSAFLTGNGLLGGRGRGGAGRGFGSQQNLFAPLK